MLTDTLCVSRSSQLQHLKSSVGENREPPASICDTEFAPDATGLLKASDSVGDPARLGSRRIGEVAHAERPSRGLLQEPENLEVGPRHADITLQIAVELDEQGSRGSGEGAEDT